MTEIVSLITVLEPRTSISPVGDERPVSTVPTIQTRLKEERLVLSPIF